MTLDLLPIGIAALLLVGILVTMFLIRKAIKMAIIGFVITVLVLAAIGGFIYYYFFII